MNKIAHIKNIEIIIFGLKSRIYIINIHKQIDGIN